MTESEAIALLKQGDLWGLEFLVNQYYFQAVRSAYLIVLDTGQAEDIVQTAFLHASEKIHQLSSERFGAWFLRSVIHAAMKSAAKQKRLISLDLEEEEEIQCLAEWLMDARPTPEEVVESEELKQGVWMAIGKLSATQRAEIVMKYYLDMSEAEIAQELRAPRSTIKWNLYTAREKLRTLLHAFRNSTSPIRKKPSHLHGQQE